MPAHVYVLQRLSTGPFFIGSTSDLSRRGWHRAFALHAAGSQGKKQATSHRSRGWRQPWITNQVVSLILGPLSAYIGSSVKTMASRLFASRRAPFIGHWYIFLVYWSLFLDRRAWKARREAAEVLCVSRGTLKSRLYRGREIGGICFHPSGCCR